MVTLDVFSNEANPLPIDGILAEDLLVKAKGTVGKMI